MLKKLAAKKEVRDDVFTRTFRHEDVESYSKEVFELQFSWWCRLKVGRAPEGLAILR